jgi:hypothetical protein
MDIKNFDYHFYIYINDLNATILDTEGKAYDDYEKNKEKRILHIDKEIVKDFDVTIYMIMNKDLELKNQEKALFHYVKHGHKENRISTLSQLEKTLPHFHWLEYLFEHPYLLSLLQDKRDCFLYYIVNHIQFNHQYNQNNLIPIDFDWKFYKSFYYDLHKLKTYKDALFHFITKGITEKRYVWFEVKEALEQLDLQKYKEENYDLQNFSEKEIFHHWITHGVYEERLFIPKEKTINYSSIGIAISIYSDKNTPDERLNASMMCLNYIFLMMQNCKIYLIIDGNIEKNHLKFLMKIKKYHKNCFIYRNKENFGIAKTKNICLHLLSKDEEINYYCLLDDDILIKKNFSDFIIKIFKETDIPLISNFNKLLPFFEKPFDKEYLINSRFYFGNVICVSKESFQKFGYMQKFDYKWGDEHIEFTKRYLRNSKYENIAVDFRFYIDDFFMINKKSTLHLHSCSTNEEEVKDNHNQYRGYLRCDGYVDFEVKDDFEEIL